MASKSGTNENTAYVLISTHGAIHGLEKTINHDIHLNVYKINATAVGVCNMVEDGVLSQMGEDMKSFISVNYRLSPDDMVRELREELPQIDEIHKEAFAIKTKQTTNRNKTKHDVYMNTRTYKPRKVNAYEDNNIIEQTDIEGDPDVYGPYVNHSDKAYSSVEWKMGDSYHNKHYTLIRRERSETNPNMYNNTVMLLNKEDGFVDLDLVGIRHNTRSQAKEEDNEDDEEEEDVSGNKYNIEFTMKDIFEELHTKGYTDAVIIDLSCAAGEDDRDERKIRRTLRRRKLRRRTLPKNALYGGGKRTTKRKRKTKTKRKTKLKRKQK